MMEAGWTRPLLIWPEELVAQFIHFVRASSCRIYGARQVNSCILLNSCLEISRD